jgi:hypothetical protein
MNKYIDLIIIKHLILFWQRNNSEGPKAIISQQECLLPSISIALLLSLILILLLVVLLLLLNLGLLLLVLGSVYFIEEFIIIGGWWAILGLLSQGRWLQLWGVALGEEERLLLLHLECILECWLAAQVPSSTFITALSDLASVEQLIIGTVLLYLLLLGVVNGWVSLFEHVLRTIENIALPGLLLDSWSKRQRCGFPFVGGGTAAQGCLGTLLGKEHTVELIIVQVCFGDGVLLLIDILEGRWTIVVIALGTLLVLHIIHIENHIPVVRLVGGGLVAEAEGVASDELIVVVIGIVWVGGPVARVGLQDIVIVHWVVVCVVRVLPELLWLGLSQGHPLADEWVLLCHLNLLWRGLRLSLFEHLLQLLHGKRVLEHCVLEQLLGWGSLCRVQLDHLLQYLLDLWRSEWDQLLYALLLEVELLQVDAQLLAHLYAFFPWWQLLCAQCFQNLFELIKLTRPGE